MRVTLSRPCPGVPFRPFQAAPLRTPAAICQGCGLPPIASPSPRGCCLCPYSETRVAADSLFGPFHVQSLSPGFGGVGLPRYLCCKVTAIFINCKKNLKKYLILLIIKHLQRGIFAVKRFNNPCPEPGGLCSGSSIHTCARVCTYAGTGTAGIY